jgi:hypothetical protein
VSVEALDAIRKSVVVAAPVERAWEVFVERMGSWWPLATHSIGGEQTETAIATPDRIFERWQDGFPGSTRSAGQASHAPLV